MRHAGATMNNRFARKFAEFRRADRKFAWLFDQWKWRYFAYRHRKQVRLNLDFDRDHGVETAQEVALEVAGVPPADVSRGNGVYRPLTEQLFRAALGSIAIDATKFTF